MHSQNATVATRPSGCSQSWAIFLDLFSAEAPPTEQIPPRAHCAAGRRLRGAEYFRNQFSSGSNTDVPICLPAGLVLVHNLCYHGVIFARWVSCSSRPLHHTYYAREEELFSVPNKNTATTPTRVTNLIDNLAGAVFHRITCRRESLHALRCLIDKRCANRRRSGSQSRAQRHLNSTPDFGR